MTKLTLKHQRLHLRWKKCEELKNVLEKYFGFSPAHALTSFMYGVSLMGSNVLKNPVKVMELGDQMKGYLKRTQDEGLRYQVDFKDEIVLQAYSDASFSPEGSESHGSFLILLEGSPIFW